MNEWGKTAAMVLIGAALAGAAWLTRPAGVREISLLSDQGQPLTPQLTNPADVKSLEVVSFDESAARMRAFKVTFDGTRWVIPSESNYPADAEAKMGRAAAAFVGLLKERVVTDNPADHGVLGVLAPDDDLAVGAGGRGTRVTMRDGAGRVVADIIIGKAPPPSDERPGAGTHRYVRESGKPRVYLTSIEGGFSTRFVDWVQTDLLEFRPESARAIRINRYRINEATGESSDPSLVSLDFTPGGVGAAEGGSGTWSLSDGQGRTPGPDEAVNIARLTELTQTLAGLRLLGVRPKPGNLARVLADPTAEATLTLNDQASMNRHGFYLSRNGSRLFASEGEIHITAADGVAYSLWLGVVAGDADRAAAGGQVGETGSTNPSGDIKAAESRYVMLTAGFDQSVLPEPQKPAALAEADTPPADGSPAKPDTPELAAVRRTWLAEHDAWKARVEAGKAKADRLSRRFANWYYQIDAASLTKLRPSFEELVAPKAKPNGPGPIAPALPPELPPGEPATPVPPEPL